MNKGIMNSRNKKKSRGLRVMKRKKYEFIRSFTKNPMKFKKISIFQNYFMNNSFYNFNILINKDYGAVYDF